jgi:hypothetical protein
MSSADFYGISAMIFVAHLLPKNALWFLWAFAFILSLVERFVK